MKLFVSMAALSCLIGCGSAPAKPSAAAAPAPVANVDDMVVQSAPMAVNWDDRPGPDGLEVAIHFFQAARKQPLPVQGSLEFKLYEGALSGQTLQNAPVFHEWRYNGGDLRAALRRTSYGWGYVFRLGWGAQAPHSKAVTLISRYTSPSGSVLAAQPISILVTAE